MFVLLLTGFATLMAEGSQGRLNCSYSSLAGRVVASSSVSSNVTAASRMKCIVSQCGCISACTLSFHRPSGSCLSAPVNAPLQAADDRWETFVNPAGVATSSATEATTSAAANPTSPSRSVTSQPVPAGAVGLWLLDNVEKGRNLGSAGDKLDLVFASAQWKADGPPGHDTGRKYSLFGRSGASVQLVQGGKRIFDFRQSFTYAAWLLKATKIQNYYYNILGGGPSKTELYDDGGIYSFVLKSRVWSTEASAREQKSWLHLAFSFVSKTEATFYINGKRMRDWSNKNYVTTSDVFTTLFVGNENGSEKQSQFSAFNLACLVLYQRALSADEVKQLMTSCP